VNKTGNYLITLLVGKDYAFNVNKRGYLFYSDNYSLKDKSPDSTYEKNIPLQPIEVNASIVLKKRNGLIKKLCFIFLYRSSTANSNSFR